MVKISNKMSHNTSCRSGSIYRISEAWKNLVEGYRGVEKDFTLWLILRPKRYILGAL